MPEARAVLICAQRSEEIFAAAPAVYGHCLAIFMLAHVQLNTYRVLKENKPNDLKSPHGHLLVYASVAKTLCGGTPFGISLKGASKVRRRFSDAGILHQTRAYAANKFCARFRWTPQPMR